MQCARCVVDVHPYQELAEDGKIRDYCPLCQGPMTGVAQPAAPAPVPTDDLVEQAKRQLAAAEIKLHEFEKLKQYAEKLRRMIAAAES